MATEPLDPESQEGYLLVRAAHQVSRPWFSDLREHGINPHQFSMLACLARDPGISQGELARRVMISAQSVSESITSLLDADLVSRETAPRGRPRPVVLTTKGQRLLARAYPVVRASNEASFASLTAKERAELSRILKKLLG